MILQKNLLRTGDSYVKAVILSVGDELVMGQTVDSNSAWLSARLAENGVMTLFHKTVADDQAATTKAMKEALEAAQLVIVTGGLGPTPDDLTRQAIADLLNQPLEVHQPSLEKIRGFFRSLGREMPAVNGIQAMCPRGAEMLDNECGTASGLRLLLGGSVLYAFPGVPREMKEMYARYVAPGLTTGAGRVIRAKKVNTFGAGESVVSERLGALMDRNRNPVVGTTVADGIVSVRVRSEFPTAEECQKELDQTVQMIRDTLGNLVFGADSETLQEVVAGLLLKQKKRLVILESGTGGWLAALLTERPEADKFFDGGYVVPLSKESLMEWAGGSGEVLAQGVFNGAMAESVAKTVLERKTNSDLAVAVIGPVGASESRQADPVGTVWIALAERNGRNVTTRSDSFRFPGDRISVRDRASKTALNQLRLYLTA